MKKMITGILIAIVAVAAAFLTGCATASSGAQGEAALVQTVLSKMLPSDFSGPVELTHSNQYFVISIKGVGVRKNADGKWAWDKLEYERSSHFPLIAGVQWSSTGKIVLGQTK